MENDTLFIVQFNPVTKELKLVKLDNARQNPEFSFESVQAIENSDIRIKSAFINPIKIATSIPQEFLLKKPINPHGIKTNYGYLYNGFAVKSNLKIASEGWHVPSNSDWSALISFLGGNPIAAAKLMSKGINFWNQPNDHALDSVGFSGNGNGYRDSLGKFDLLKEFMYFWSGSNLSASIGYIYYSQSTSPNLIQNTADLRYGCAVRLIKDSTTLQDGQKGTYVGNDGILYETICIGNQEWLASNLKETLFRDLSVIPIITDSNLWNQGNGFKMCAYNNDYSLL